MAQTFLISMTKVGETVDSNMATGERKVRHIPHRWIAALR